jgi:hypothetical protein
LINRDRRAIPSGKPVVLATAGGKLAAELTTRQDGWR